MSLPPGFLDELRGRVTLSDVAGRKVTWDARKSTPAKGDFWAPCPFHQEKTPSFHVDDRKGFYYCFGCHAKGDLITFVMETENIGFIEAVERIAAEAGMEMPAATRDPRAAETRDRQARLLEAMEAAARFFGMALRSGAGQGARDYVRGRGLSDETLARFELGFAPDARTRLAEHLAQKGLTEEGIAAGLLIRPEEGGAPFDRFRNRLMFPIRDPRGRLIAFGGRALGANAQAKYLNSPETELFHKGRTLYNHGPAREAAAKAGTLIVAEGYMDVIALAAAGFGHAVAPLGTAVTEEQLALLWRIADEPVIALDGDKAGVRAAERLIDMALPLLAPGRSLRFCLLPDGLDPDDLIRERGAAAMAEVLGAALPLVEMLWRREVAAGPLDTPERRAGFDRRLREALARIGDESVRAHYAAEIRERRAALLRPARPPARGPSGAPRRDGGRRGAEGPQPTTRNSDRARAGGLGPAEAAAREREATILLLALRHAPVLAPLEAQLEDLVVTTADFAPLHRALLDRLAGEEAPVDPEAPLLRVAQARMHPAARPDAEPARVLAELAELVALHHAALAQEAARREAAAGLREVDAGDLRIDLDDPTPLDEAETAALRAVVDPWRSHLDQTARELEAARRRAAELPSDSATGRRSGIQDLLDAQSQKGKKPRSGL